MLKLYVARRVFIWISDPMRELVLLVLLNFIWLHCCVVVLKRNFTDINISATKRCKIMLFLQHIGRKYINFWTDLTTTEENPRIFLEVIMFKSVIVNIITGCITSRIINKVWLWLINIYI